VDLKGTEGTASLFLHVARYV